GGKSLNAQGAEVGAGLFLSILAAKGSVDLNDAKINGPLVCDGAEFDGVGGMALNANRLSVKAGFFWRGASVFQGVVYLASAHVGDLTDDQLSWPTGTDQLVLDGFTYDRIVGASTDAASRMSWLENGAVFKGTFYPQPYTQLAKVLSEMGHDRDARKVLEKREQLLAVEARLARYRKPDGVYLFPLESPKEDVIYIWNWATDGLARLVVGYGYAPMRSLWWLAGLFVIATIFAHYTWHEGQFAPNSDVVITSPGWTALLAVDCIGPLPAGHTDPCIQNPAKAWSDDPAAGMDWDSFNRYGYAADLVIPILDLGQTDAWAPSKDRGAWGWWLWWLRWVLSGAGWIVTGLGAAAVTGIIKRDRG
ncbi:MAG: hypothetical protein MUD11_11865, partial [Rhodobacteraceae bacterium]|nr:hypothetical protein [Paracoccaceae bacterium]